MTESRFAVARKEAAERATLQECAAAAELAARHLTRAKDMLTNAIAFGEGPRIVAKKSAAEAVATALAEITGIAEELTK